MPLDLTDGVTTVTIKPHTVINTKKYAIKPILHPTVVNIGLESRRVELMFRTNDSTTLNFLANVGTTITVQNSTISEVPNGNYSVEAIEVKRDSKTQSVADVRISMFEIA